MARFASHEGSRTLLWATPVFVFLAIAASAVLGRFFSGLPSLLVLASVYWCGCWVLALRMAPWRRLRDLYRACPEKRPREVFLTWIPTLAVAVVLFVSPVSELSFVTLGLILVLAVINGVTEEAFWRGAFVAAFPGRIGWAYFFPTAFFTIWHVALLMLPDIEYAAGVPGMVLGPAVAGACWGWVVWRSGDLRSVSLAHVLANVATFASLASRNWPAS